MDTTHSLLKTALAAAVPLWVERVRGWDPAYRLERARICAQEAAEHGDVLQFRSKKRGESAAVFNRLAEGIAIMAFQPDGVEALGLKFEVRE